mgnify:CR=1 FL=1
MAMKAIARKTLSAFFALLLLTSCSTLKQATSEAYRLGYETGKGFKKLGDLGNVIADSQGNASYNHEDHLVTLFGAYSVLGRSCVLHADVDDLGTTDHPLSSTTGNAGGRVACGVIGTKMP